MRNLRVKTIVSATMGFALVVAGMPGTAEADVCRRVDARAGCVNSRDVRTNSLTGADVRDNSLTGADVADLTGADVADNSLSAADLNDEAGADFASGDQTVPLGPDATVRSVTITAPTTGRVIVSASGFFEFLTGGVAEGGQCSITTGAALDDTHVISVEESLGTPNSMFRVPFGATRGFDVAAGSTAFNLVCNEVRGSVTVNDTSLTAIFVPGAY